MLGVLAAFSQSTKFFRQGLQMASGLMSNTLVAPESISLASVRTKVRCYFPRPNEVKRVRKQGWETRKTTPGGRRVLMRRLLKGRHVLSH